MMDLLTSGEAWAAFLTLCLMEIILGVDNIVFISIQTDKLPQEQQKRARHLGLLFALFTRIVLLLSITWIMTLTEPLFNIAEWFGIDGEWHERLAISGRDLILLAGGLFLMYKSIKEIHENVEAEPEVYDTGKPPATLMTTIIQIGLLDIVFGLDSVITAVGMADDVEIMIAAVVVSMIFMVFSLNFISKFVNEHPSVKILALSFLLLIGISLIAESIEQPIAKGYIYSAMAFSIFVEILVIRSAKNKGKKRTA